VHYHFPSLQALLTEAAVGLMREVAGSIGPLLDRASTPADALALLMSSLDEYTGRDPASMVVTETYLAATRDPALREAVTGVLADFRDLLAAWLRGHGVPAPEDTATVLAAAIDGLLLHRALDPTVTTGTVTPVLDRLVRH
jgi:AcrR family transcriptional regulator